MKQKIYDSSTDWYIADDEGLVHYSGLDQETATNRAHRLGAQFTAYKDTGNTTNIMAEFFGYVDLNSEEQL